MKWRKEKPVVTLWDCVKDIRSVKDFRDTLSLFVPMPIYRGWQWIAHPIYRWRQVQSVRWAKSRKLGDIVCDCRGVHGVITEFRDWDQVVIDGEHACSLTCCCAPVETDGSCHGTTQELSGTAT